MEMCQQHWKAMRDAVEAHGMTPLVSIGGESALRKTLQEFNQGKVTADTFDPLMAMFFTICGNLMDTLGQSAGYLLTTGPEDPIDVDKIPITTTNAGDLKRKYRGKTWPRCPICYANITHEITCRSIKCALPRVNGYDFCIEASAKGVKLELDRLLAREIQDAPKAGEE